MNHVTIESPAADARATAGLLELGNGALLAYAAEIAEFVATVAAESAGTAAAAEVAKTAPTVASEETGALAALRQALKTERPRIADLLPSLAPEEIAFLLADLLSQALAASGAAADLACVLALSKEGTVHVLASGGGVAYLAPAGFAGSAAAIPVRRVRDGAVSFLLPGVPSPAPSAVPLGAAARRIHPSEVIRLPIGRESQVVLVSGEIEPTLEERLLAALQSSREPAALDPLLRGPIERAGGALVAFVTTSQPEAAKDGIESELAVFRREVERRLARLDGRLKEMENDALRAAASPRRSGFAFPGVPSLARPKPPLVRRPLPGSLEDLASADDAPAFERGLDVPVASNWSRPLLLVTGGITLVLFLALQLFCHAEPRRRAIPPRKATAPATSAPAAGSKAPVGVLLVTPSSESEGTEGAAPGPPNVSPHR
jgi:hypothetical protein